MSALPPGQSGDAQTMSWSSFMAGNFNTYGGPSLPTSSPRNEHDLTGTIHGMRGYTLHQAPINKDSVTGVDATIPRSETAESAVSSFLTMQQIEQIDPALLLDEDALSNASTSEETTHSYIQISTPTRSSVINRHIRPIDLGEGAKAYACAFPGCARRVGFHQKSQATSHIRSVHLREKPFACTCGKFFLRRPDAIRHVTTKNAGKRYKCSVCSDAFERKDYRDTHEAECLATY